MRVERPVITEMASLGFWESREELECTF